MSLAETNIIVSPERLWDYFEKHRESLIKTMEPVAENKDYDVIIYLSNENDRPVLTIESSNVESDEYIIEDKEGCSAIVTMVYDLYLTDQIITVMMEEAEDDDDASELEIQEVIKEREADIDSFIERLIEDLFSEDPAIYSDLIIDVIEDCKEHFLEYLYRKHGLSVYRPMELEDDEGVFVEDYPYECMEFDPNPLYEKEEK